MTTTIIAKTAIALAATALITAAPANAQMAGLKAFDSAAKTDTAIVHKTSRKGRRIAAGIALGILGAAALASQAHAGDGYREERFSRHERRCNRWRRWCRDGERDACWKFDNRC